MSVPLPPPDGELTTKSVPRVEGVMTCVAVFKSVTLLDILNLFAKFLHLGFDRQSRLFNRQIS